MSEKISDLLKQLDPIVKQRWIDIHLKSTKEEEVLKALDELITTLN
jgi:hypothetical protein